MYLQSPLPLNRPKSVASAPSTVCPTRMATPVSIISRSSSPYRPQSAQPRQPSPDYPIDAGILDIQHHRFSGLVKEEPLQRPSSRLAVLNRRSATNSSLYQTPPEYADHGDEEAHPQPLFTAGSSPFKQPQPLQTTSPSDSIELLEHYYQPLSASATTRRESLRQKTRRITGSEQKSVLGKEDRGNGSEGDEGCGIKGVRSELRRLFSGR